MKKNFIVDTQIALTEFLIKSIPLATKNALKKQISIGEVKVNGKRVKTDILLKSGDAVEIFLPLFLDAENKKIPVIYEDENIAVANKPVLCDSETHLPQLLKEKYGDLFPVHRLDMNTTGLIVMARNLTALEALKVAFKNSLVKKTYVADVYGRLKEEKAVLKAYIYKNTDKKISTVDTHFRTGGKEIITAYEVLEYKNGISTLKIQIITGRTHQIRAHFAYLGHPVVGDGKYGKLNAGEKYQRLKSVKIEFSGLSGSLEYLNGMKFELDELSKKL